MSVMIEGPSSGGKSELIKRQIKVLPDHAVYELQSISDKALAYMGRDALRDRFLVVFELGGLGKEGDAGIEMAKQLLTEGRIKRQIADSTPNGVRGRLVEVEGPTGLWTTTTKLVTDTELNNRLFKLTVDDSPEQTGRIVACIFDEDREPMDFSPIRALHTWIEAQDNRVTLPFGRALGTLMLYSATRMRRDALRVRDLICAHAVLHQASRERDEQGRIVATLEDYEAVRALIDNIIGVAAEQSVSSFVRETVQAVRALIDDNKPVNRTTLGQRFGIAASNASRRLGAATAAGYIKHDPDATGKTKQYVMGDVPLPEDKAALPSVEELDACARALRAQGEGMTASDGECYKRTPSARVRAHVGHHVPLTSTKPLTNGDYGVEGDEDEAPPTDPAHTAHARTHDALDHELAPKRRACAHPCGMCARRSRSETA